jgi:hypothetical protein
MGDQPVTEIGEVDEASNIGRRQHIVHLANPTQGGKNFVLFIVSQQELATARNDCPWPAFRARPNPLQL